MSEKNSAAGQAAQTTAGWDSEFESILRPYLPFLAADSPLADDADLPGLGLDSVGSVELMATLENAYSVRFLDDALTLENFASPHLVWHTLKEKTEPDT
ncbi:phosphopantetheine-binding protein [Streptomyces sp. NPDC051940]|uniref:phosphopantetheine-binding protein n=1 Tax=Streptomyces sp. NPDC051940 TaxID=3155675 RepID=UPI00342C268E